MKVGSIPISWMSITNAMSAEVNLNLLAEVDKQGIAHDDLPAVKKVWEYLKVNAEAVLVSENESSKIRQAEEKAAAGKIKNIKSQFPTLQWKK